MCKHIHAVTKTEIKADNSCTEETDSDKNQVQLTIDYKLREEPVQEEILKEISKRVDFNSSLEKKKLKLIQEFETLTRRVTSLKQADFVQNEMRRITTTVDAMNLPTKSRPTLKVCK